MNFIKAHKIKLIILVVLIIVDAIFWSIKLDLVPTIRNSDIVSFKNAMTQNNESFCYNISPIVYMEGRDINDMVYEYYKTGGFMGGKYSLRDACFSEIKWKKMFSEINKTINKN
jgi:hypothetical protein